MNTNHILSKKSAEQYKLIVIVGHHLLLIGYLNMNHYKPKYAIMMYCFDLYIPLKILRSAIFQPVYKSIYISH
jgi:hypothetical protein